MADWRALSSQLGISPPYTSDNANRLVKWELFRNWKHFLALPNLVTGSLRSKIDRILAFKQVVSTVALSWDKAGHDTAFICQALPMQHLQGNVHSSCKGIWKDQILAGATTWFSNIHCKQLAVPVKETWSTTVGNKTETKHQSTNCGALKRQWYPFYQLLV